MRDVTYRGYLCDHFGHGGCWWSDQRLARRVVWSGWRSTLANLDLAFDVGGRLCAV